jgi:putative NADPH-quinone reductase
MTHVLVLQGHPDPAPERLCRALAEAYAAGAVAGGHTLARLDLATIDVPILRSQQEFEHGEMPASLRPVWEAILEADHLVLVFPLWLGTMPALVKAALEQLFRPGLAFGPATGPAGIPERRLAGRSARLVVTMGMPSPIYRLWYREHGTAGLRRNVLNFAGYAPVRTSLFGMVEKADADTVAAWTAKLRRLGERAA